MRQKASVEGAPAQVGSMKVCKPCHARKVLCDLARPVCSACLRYSKDRPNHRCEYGPNAAMPGEAKSLRPDRSLDVDETFQPLPRTRSAARALLGTAQPSVERMRADGEAGGSLGEGPVVDAALTNEASLTSVHAVLPSPSRNVPAVFASAPGTTSSRQSGGAVLSGQTVEVTPAPDSLSGISPATPPPAHFLGTDAQQPTVPSHLPLALLTPNQQLLPHALAPAPFISIFQPETPESAPISTPSSRPVSIVREHSANGSRLPSAPPLPPRTTIAYTAPALALPPLPAVHTHPANGAASFARPVCPLFPPSIPDARSRHSISAPHDFARQAATEVPAATQPHPHDSMTFADIGFSHNFVGLRRNQPSQHTLLPLFPPRPLSGGNLNAVLASGSSSSFDTLCAYN